MKYHPSGQRAVVSVQKVHMLRIEDLLVCLITLTLVLNWILFGMALKDWANQIDQKHTDTS